MITIDLIFNNWLSKVTHPYRCRIFHYIGFQLSRCYVIHYVILFNFEITFYDLRFMHSHNFYIAFSFCDFFYVPWDLDKMKFFTKIHLWNFLIACLVLVYFLCRIHIWCLVCYPHFSSVLFVRIKCFFVLKYSNSLKWVIFCNCAVF